MKRTIETSMVHAQSAYWIAREIEFCAQDGGAREERAEHTGQDTLVCHICDERIVELAIRKEYALVHRVLSVILKEA